MEFRIGRATLSARSRGIVGAVVLFCASPFAAADPTGPLSCVEGQFGVGGCPPYGQVIFFGAGVTGPNSVFEYERPVLDFSPSAPGGTLRGVVDLSQGLLRTYAQANDDGNPSTNNGASMNAVGVDLFTLHRLGAPSPDFFSFSVVFTAEGVGGIDNPFYSVGSYLSIRPDSVNGAPLGISGGKLDAGSVLQAGTHVPVFQQFSVNLMTFANLSARLDQPFQLTFSLRTDVSERSFLDFMHTARISFLLPEGVTVTSMGGFDSAGVPAIPEPSTWLLMMAAGLAGTARLARIRRRDV
ncbi:MAG: PEP-CTERM sorting domain-containing protein [Burkholderiales bacterium]|nr:PEP-CTERM sorting domain-containing protein [Burkholderiales bacterium]